MFTKRFSLLLFFLVLFVLSPTAYSAGVIPSEKNLPDSFGPTSQDAPAAVYLVTNTNDSGAGSLRQAILNANAAPPGNVMFNIPVSDSGFNGNTFTIHPLSTFPILRNNVTIDGSTQTTFTGDTNPVGPEVVVNGGFTISGDHNQINNLVLKGVGMTYTLDSTPSYNHILHNYIGTDATGTQAVAGSGGVGISGFASPSAQAQQNVIDGNLISGNSWNGITLCDADGTLITNNLIGVDRTGTQPLGNAAAGILLTCAGSPSNQIIGNIIAYNGEEGIIDEPDYRYGVAYTADGHQGNRFSQNSIFVNGGIGINLLPPPFGYYDEVTPNDSGDGDAGGNLLQNFPVITGVSSDGVTTTINGTLNSTANQTFTIELFLNDTVDDSGHGEGQMYLTSVTATTNSSGNASFVATVSQGATSEQFVTALATNPAGNSSEFSAAMAAVSTNQPPVADAGGPYAGEEGGTILLDASNSSDPNGTITSYEWDLNGDGEYGDATGITTTVTFVENGSYTIRLRVMDDKGSTNEDTAETNVHNVSPTVNAGDDQYLTEGSNVSLPPATFGDPGSLDTHVAVIDWGDGTTESGLVSDNRVSGNHSYSIGGDYIVQVCVSDDDGGTGCANFTATILEPPTDCNLYPISLHQDLVANVLPGTLIENIPHGVRPNKFGWLSWTGDKSETSLVASLTSPGDSSTYINPNNSVDHIVSIGDWVPGRLSAPNTRLMLQTLDMLQNVNIIVPLWGNVAGDMNHLQYEMTGFVWIRLEEYHLEGRDRISVRFLGNVTCPDNHAPFALDDIYTTDTTRVFTVLPPGALLNDSDLDGDLLTAVLVDTTTNGTLTLNVDGSFTYISEPGFEGTDTFTYVASDGELNSNVATVSIAVVFPWVIVPDVVGLVEAEAEATILAANLTVGITTTAYSENIPIGHIVSQSPVAGEEVLADTPIDFVISLGPEPPVGVCQVYNTNSDFDMGNAINVGYSTPDQLQLNNEVETFNFIWVAVSSKGTVVKIDTATGQILGEYYTSPQGQPRNPSRTTVDLNGNVWTANRDGNSVVHIGLQENGQCVDRNGNGVIDTSTGLNNILTWTNAGGADTNGGVSTATDECILHYTRVSSAGTRHVSVNSDNDVWVSGTGSRQFNLLDGDTGQIVRTEPSVGYGGYGGLIDEQGVIWSARPLLRWNTQLPLTGPNGGNWIGYGHDSYGLCIDSQNNVWNTSSSGNIIRKFSPTGTLLGTFSHGDNYAQGCAIDDNDHVWVAHSTTRNTVGHLNNNGVFVGNVTVGSGPTGVAIDSEGRVWATNYASGTVSRIDPNAGPIGADGVTRIGAVDFTTAYLGGNLYNYSDMTGSTLTGAPDAGTWTAVFDSELDNASWGTVGWFADVLADGAFAVTVATSHDGVSFSPPVTVVNGEELSVPDGRYLQITASFNRATTGESPILYDISACTAGLPLPPINHPPVAEDDAFGADGGNVLNNDTDPDEDTLTAVLHTAPLHGTVTLNADGAFTYIPEPGFEGTDTFTYVANDGQLDSNVATVSIEVVLPRTIVPDVVGLAEAEAEADIIAASLTVGVTTTAHSETIPAGHVISQNPVAGEEVLLGTAVDLVISLGAATATVPDVVGLPQADAEADIVAASLIVGTVTTAHSDTVPVGHVISQNPAGGTNVTAGTAVDLVISLGPALPNPPQAQSQAITTNEDVPLTITLQATDVDSPNLTFAFVSGPGWGSLGVLSAPTCTSSGGGTTCTATVTYTPAANEYGYDSFTFLAHDGLTASTPALVEVTVNPVNDAPIAVGYGFDMPEDNYLVVPAPGLFNRVYDIEGDPLTVAADDQPAHGVLELDATGAFTYTPQLNFNGVDSFTFVANDGLLNSLPATLLITVTAVADAPVAVNDAYSVAANSGLTVPAPGTLGNDSDGDGDALTAVLVSNPLHGTLTLNANGSFTYTPNGGYSGADNFSYRANDGGLNSNSATVAITVMPPGNQPPTAVPDTYNVTADQTLTAATPGVLGNDSDPNGNPLTAVLVSTVAHGTLTLNANGSFSYTPTAGYTGSDSFTYRAHDGSLNSNDAIVTITVNPPAGPPPVVDITAPVSGATVTSPTDLMGTADSTALAEWQWAVRPLGGSDWLTILTGTTPVVNGTFGQFDPTLLLNGRYELRLTAIDTAGQFASETIEVLVKGDMKVGIFTLSFVDMEIPVAGLPLQVIRTYDSRDKAVGDFGYGWRMDLRNVQAKENTVPGLDWEGVRYDHLFFDEYCIYPATPHLVTVTLPDGTVYEFSAAVTSQCQLVLPQDQVTVSFTPRPGTNATLSIVGNNQAFVFGDFEVPPNSPGDIELWDLDDLIPFNPSQYRLTLPDGRVLLLDEADGMVQITDLNGNQLNISDTGITHSAGPDIEFVRDGQGRITQIIDPAGQTVSYEYDTNGDLVLVTDQAGYTTTMAYENDHYLTNITDSRGIQAVRNEYDENGRLTAHVDANGQRIEYTHDIDGRQELITDRLGHVTLYVYDDRGNVLAQTDAEGHTTTYTYDGRDNMLTETDPLGHTTTYTYDSRDNLLTQTDPLGHITRYTYNSLNLVLTITDPLGNVTTNTYDGDGNLLTTTDPMGHVTTYTYDSRGLQTSMTDPLGNVTTYVYDSVGNLLREVNALGYATVYTYDTISNRLSQTVTRTVGSMVETLVTSYVYDARGRLTRTTYPDGSQTRTIYGSLDQPGITIDALGRETHYSYDALGRLLSTTYPDGTTESQTYDAEGRRTSSTDRGGRVTTFVYDANGRLTSTISPDGATMTTVYDANGRVSQVIDPRGNSTSYSYDDAGRQTAVTDALGHVTTFTYDDNGNQASMTDANGHTTSYEYDDNGRRTRVIYADGTDSETTYDALGRSIAQTDQAGITTQFTYDALGQLTAVSDALGQVTSYTYDEVGNQLTQTDANGHTTTFATDNMGRRTVRTLPLGMLETYAYDVAGNLVSKTDFNGRTTTYLYDAMNRLLSKTPDPFFSQPPVSYTYTASGQRASMTDSTGTTLYLYDGRDRLITKTTPFGSLFYSYDLAGNLLSMDSSNANGVSVDYTYDALNRLATATDNRLVNGVTSYSYDDVGNLAGYLYPNGVQTSYVFNELNRLTDMSVANNTTTLASYAYTLGAAGNRLSVAELGGRTVSYGYDNLYRLTSETIAGDMHGNNGVIGYVYDPVGNRLERNSTVAAIPTTFYGYDANDRLTSDMYDANGNTTLSEGNSYAYDFENRLVSLNSGEVTMQYDGDGNRVTKTVAGVTTHYLVDDRNLTGYAQVMEEIVGTAVQRQYTYGLDLISQNQIISGTWAINFYGYDGHSGVRVLINSDALTADTYDYDAFGILMFSTASTPNVYLYSGEQYEASLNLYYLRARFLNARLGRFVTVDGFDGNMYDPLSLHKYVYSHANPANLIDPSGLSVSTGKLTELGLVTGITTILLKFQLTQLDLTGAFTSILDKVKSRIQTCPRTDPSPPFPITVPVAGSTGCVIAYVRGPEKDNPRKGCHVNVVARTDGAFPGRYLNENYHVEYSRAFGYYINQGAGLANPGNWLGYDAHTASGNISEKAAGHFISRAYLQPTVVELIQWTSAYETWTRPRLEILATMK